MTITEYLQPMLESTKRIPATLAVAFLFQIAGVLFWAGSSAERLTVLERTQGTNQSAIERVAVLEDQITTMKDQLARIETKLDRLQDK